MSTAIYIRVSSVGQNLAGQREAIKQWLTASGIDSEAVSWWEDKESGDTLDRPAFERLRALVASGEVRTVVVYKLDRLSRNMRDGFDLLCDWCEAGVRVVSVTQQLDLSGTVGRMLAAVLLGIAEMEQETRRERQAAGIAVAKREGKYKGSQAGRRVRLTEEKEKQIHSLNSLGHGVAEIARTLELSRTTVYKALRR